MSNQTETLKTNGISKNGTKIDKVFSKITIIAGICYISVILTIFMLTNEEVTKPYMDEVFHIDQIRSYCDHNFTYVSSYNFFQFFSIFFNFFLSFFVYFAVESKNYYSTRTLCDNINNFKTIFRIVRFWRRRFSEKMSRCYDKIYKFIICLWQCLFNVYNKSSQSSAYSCK